MPAPSAASSTRCATSTRRSATAPTPAPPSPDWRWPPAAGGRRTSQGHAGHTRMATARRLLRPEEARRRCAGSNAVTPDRVLTFDKATNVHYSGTAPRGEPAGAPARADRRLPFDLRPGVRPPVRPVLPGQRLRDGRQRRRRPPAADQRLQLRALQDLRHHGSRTASSRGWRPKAAKARSTTACDRRRPTDDAPAGPEWQHSWRKRAQVALIAGLGAPLLGALGAHAALDASRAPSTSTAIDRGRRTAHRGVLARPHPARHVLLPRSRHRRHDQRELRRRVDRAHHPALRLRHGARLDVARRRPRPARSC